jgi:hypothetical protein
MKPMLQALAVLAGMIAAGAHAQEPPIPAGNWQSPRWATYTNPFLAGAEMYLNIDVARDGGFRGRWSQYFCTSTAGAYGVTVISCSLTGKSYRVSGRFGPDRRGVIDLERLGRSAFSWSAPAANELAINLPKNWQGSDPILYRASLTRDGKGTPTRGAAPARDEGPLLSAVALYREFNKDTNAALARYGGKTLVLEGRRGELIQLSSGGAAIHVPDGFRSRALVLTFPDAKQASGINEGARFRFKCTVASFDYQYVHMENCSIVP